MKFDQILTNGNYPAYRLKQIKQAYFIDNVSSFDEMTTIPKDLREVLKKNTSLFSVSQIKLEESKDKKTRKALLKLADGNQIETVLMDYDNWLTVCLSSMVGCPLGCKFCATGKMGFIRNLTADEIVDQIVFWNNYLRRIRVASDQLPMTNDKNHVGNIVFMGMGEPFLNWDNLWEAINIIQDKDGLNIGDRHISISTAGVIDRIVGFTKLNTQINLAISLHAPTQDKREVIMPVAENNQLDKLMQACLDYVIKTKRKLMFEYALMNEVNNSVEDAKLLIILMQKSYLFHLNIIRLNPVEGGMVPSTPKREKAFINIIERSHVPYTIRHSFGTEISAACGQLYGKYEKSN